MTAPLLRLSEATMVRAGRDRRFVLRIPAFELAAGEALALVAPSGRGKSSLINVLGLAEPPDAAEAFLLAGVDVAALWRRGAHDALAALRAQSLGYVVQTGALLSSLTARENVALAQRMAQRVDPAFLEAVARRLGIAGLLSDKPLELSVGERQRVAIARAIAHRPAIVLADEPTAALDRANKLAVMDLLFELRAELGFALVMATHDLETLERLDMARLEPRIEIDGRETRATFRHGGLPARTA